MKLATSIPANFRQNVRDLSTYPLTLPELNKQITEYQKEFVRNETSNSRKQDIVRTVGIQALRFSTEGSQIFHIHRWTKHKKIPDAQSFVEVLRCRRCELMKSVELYTERDKSGRIVMKRLDRYVEAIDPQSLSGDKKIEHNTTYYQKQT